MHIQPLLPTKSFVNVGDLPGWLTSALYMCSSSLHWRSGRGHLLQAHSKAKKSCVHHRGSETFDPAGTTWKQQGPGFMFQIHECYQTASKVCMTNHGDIGTHKWGQVSQCRVCTCHMFHRKCHICFSPVSHHFLAKKVISSSTRLADSRSGLWKHVQLRTRFSRRFSMQPWWWNTPILQDLHISGCLMVCK